MTKKAINKVMIKILFLIVAVDKKWAIGKNGQLLIKNDYDLENFKNLTIGNIIILGSKTLETFPGKKPLKGRINIILTRNPDYKVEGDNVFIVHSIDELAALLAKLQEKHPEKKVFVCGGASIYEQLLPYCGIAYVTRFDTKIEGADAFFPNLARRRNWKIVEETPVISIKDDCARNLGNASGPTTSLRIVTYRNFKPRQLKVVD